MIRSSRGIHIRRIVQNKQLSHCGDDKHTTAIQNFSILSKWKDKIIYHVYLSSTISSKFTQRRLPHLDRKTHGRLYNTSRRVINSVTSAFERHDQTQGILSKSDNMMRNDYIQAPDSGPIISPIDVTVIHEILAERLICIVTRDSQRLKMIDEELEYGNVFVDDIAKQWRADGKRFEVYLRKVDTNKAEVVQSVSDDDRKNAYFISPYTGPKIASISESEIHKLLAERHYLRTIRDFENSDRIRKELESHGAFIDDRHRKWCGDGTKLTIQKHNYIMSRDSGPLNANITEEEIHNLLNKRHRCRLRKDFRGADVIYKKLKNRGVSIDDEIMEWRADGITFSKFLRQHPYKLAFDTGQNIANASDSEIHKLLATHWSYNQSGDTKNAYDTWEKLSKIGVFLDAMSMEWRADGVKHNYRISQDAGQNISKSTDKVIHYLLEVRMLHRWRKDFAASDLIRDKLQRDGVYLDDKNKEWRADGKPFYHLCHQYRQAPDSGPLLATLPETTIHKLLSELWQLKLSRLFDKADLVFDDLFNAGVYLNDKKAIWRADGKSCNFNVIPGAGPFNMDGTIDEGQMHRMLEDSYRLRLRQGFIEANRIQDELLAAGIFLDLNKNLYRADGIMHNYKKFPISGPSTSLIVENDVHRLLAERLRCKTSQDFASADRIFDELYDYGVFVDDETMEWRADGIYHAYRLTPDAGPIISTLPMEEIHTLIGKRVRHKKFKDFAKADLILNYLKGAKVYLDDKKREWRADGVNYETTVTKR